MPPRDPVGRANCLRVVAGRRQKVSIAPASRALPLGEAPRMLRCAGPVELPGIQLLDAGVGIGQRAVGDPQEIDGAAQVISLGAAADIQVTLVGQRDVADALSGGVELAVHVDG